MDVFSKSKRSEIMSSIRSRGNLETEVAFARILRRNHIAGWRRHLPIFGRPDFVFCRSRLAVFVDGCFWHGCREHSHTPKCNAGYWAQKIGRNVARDARNSRKLRRLGWRVLRFWHHDLCREEYVVSRIRRALTA